MAFALISREEQSEAAVRVAPDAALVTLPRPVAAVLWAAIVVVGHVLLLWILLNLAPPQIAGNAGSEEAMLVVSIPESSRQNEPDDRATVATLPEASPIPSPQTPPPTEWSIQRIRVEPTQEQTAPIAEATPMAIRATSPNYAGTRGSVPAEGEYDPYAGVAPLRRERMGRPQARGLLSPLSSDADRAVPPLAGDLDPIVRELRTRFPEDRGLIVVRLKRDPRGKVRDVDVLNSTLSAAARIAAIAALREIRLTGGTGETLMLTLNLDKDG